VKKTNLDFNSRLGRSQASEGIANLHIQQLVLLITLHRKFSRKMGIRKLLTGGVLG
jgi:hypothetical protein